MKKRKISETRVVIIEKFDTKDGWIDIKTNLPKPISTVLIWTNISFAATIGYYTGRDWMYLSVNENLWLNKHPHIKVLYWKPLPNVPTAYCRQIMKSVNEDQDNVEVLDNE